MSHNPSPQPSPSHWLKQDPTWKKPRKWPWVLGIVGALMVGAAVGYGGTPEPEIITKEVPVEVQVEVEPADMDERRAELDQREEELDERSTDLDERDEELQSLATQLEERDVALTTSESEIAQNTIPGSGIYLVGEDIKPGTYRSDSNDCYWARLSGTSGEPEDIITNNVVDGTAYVTIAASDVAFETSYCGEWKLQ